MTAAEPSLNELKAMTASAIGFLLKNIEALKQFIKKMHEDFGQSDLAFTLKMFVLNCNKAFDIAEYMKEQSRQADEYIRSQNKTFSPEERRAVLSYWIESHAAPFRKQVIFKQISCIDKMSAEIVPVIEKAIKE
jgi:cytochrome c